MADTLYMTMSFFGDLQKAVARNDSLLCVGLDPDIALMPDVGILEIRDAETGEIVRLDTALPWVRETFRENWNKNQIRLSKLFDSHRMDHLTIETGKPYDVPLIRFFEERARRIR